MSKSFDLSPAFLVFKPWEGPETQAASECLTITSLLKAPQRLTVKVTAYALKESEFTFPHLEGKKPPIPPSLANKTRDSLSSWLSVSKGSLCWGEFVKKWLQLLYLGSLGSHLQGYKPGEFNVTGTARQRLVSVDIPAQESRVVEVRVGDDVCTLFAVYPLSPNLQPKGLRSNDRAAAASLSSRTKGRYTVFSLCSLWPIWTERAGYVGSELDREVILLGRSVSRLESREMRQSMPAQRRSRSQLGWNDIPPPSADSYQPKPAMLRNRGESLPLLNLSSGRSRNIPAPDLPVHSNRLTSADFLAYRKIEARHHRLLKALIMEDQASLPPSEPIHHIRKTEFKPELFAHIDRRAYIQNMRQRKADQAKPSAHANYDPTKPITTHNRPSWDASISDVQSPVESSPSSKYKHSRGVDAIREQLRDSLGQPSLLVSTNELMDPDLDLNALLFPSDTSAAAMHSTAEPPTSPLPRVVSPFQSLVINQEDESAATPTETGYQVIHCSSELSQETSSPSVSPSRLITQGSVHFGTEEELNYPKSPPVSQRPLQSALKDSPKKARKPKGSTKPESKRVVPGRSRGKRV